MAFTRKMLKGMEIPDDKADSIIDEHLAVVDALKKERDNYKAQADKLPDLQRELEGFKGGEDWQKKYNEVKQAFEDYKKDQSAKETAAKVRAAYRKLLIDEKISEEWADKIVKLEDYSGMKLDADGNLANVDDLKAKVRQEYAGYITTTETRGAKVDNPPTGSKNTMTREEILAIKDTSARQRAIAENLNLFGKGV